MRVKFKGYNYDIETAPAQRDYFGGWISAQYQEIDIHGTVQGYVRENRTTYAIVLSDAKSLFTVDLDELEVE